MKATEHADHVQQEGEVNCRHCGATNCIRIRRGMVIKSILGFLPLKHYRCTKCLRTFYTMK